MTRTYPQAPVCAVGAIVFRGDAVLLIQRGKPPAQGKWSIPGGAVRLGETLETAVIRELSEEVEMDVKPPFDVLPTPAIRVLRVGSVGSSVRLAMEREASLSVRGIQVVPPLVDFQMPPFTAPTYSVFGFPGSAAMA